MHYFSSNFSQKTITNKTLTGVITVGVQYYIYIYNNI